MKFFARMVGPHAGFKMTSPYPPHLMNRFPNRVIPKVFTPEEYDRPYDRPQTAEEIADWLYADRYYMAPATADIKSHAPDAEWVCWSLDAPIIKNETWPYIDVHPIKNLGSFIKRWDAFVSSALVKRELEEKLIPALVDGPPENIDMTRAWLLNGSSSTAGVPEILLTLGHASLVSMTENPPDWVSRMSPRQWREGAARKRDPLLSFFPIKHVHRLLQEAERQRLLLSIQHAESVCVAKRI
ncbi:hypothetical protein [Luteibacter anthropi]|uniref:Uncharacterized protein n=1 Tax=Luteibacter anthropi TaxID=564369 RepID=A0A7X5UAL5_9GAMM|nr:hypothetical protein [Luteibacter anthropi]NII06958.1 hypothetical protein [Luteibacter anthropi]